MLDVFRFKICFTPLNYDVNMFSFTATPIAASRESTVDTYAGADIILHCTSDGEPTPQFRWIKDGTFIQNSHKFSLQGNRMIIRNVLQSDQGSYECYAENTVGFARNTVALRVFGKSSCEQFQYLYRLFT